MATIGGSNIITSGLVLALDAANPKSYVSGSTTWNDLSGNNNSGSLINGPIFSSANGGTIVFDGTNDYVLVTNPTIIKNQNFSISAWINPVSQNSALVSMIDFDHGAGQGWVLQSEDATTNRNYYFSYYDGTQFQPAGNFGSGKGVQITNSIWNNIVYTKNGTSVIGYVNGIQSVNYTASNSNVSYGSNKDLRIGDWNSGGRPFKGNIPNVQIYNRALSASEVLQNYNAQKSRYNL